MFVNVSLHLNNTRTFNNCYYHYYYDTLRANCCMFFNFIYI